MFTERASQGEGLRTCCQCLSLCVEMDGDEAIGCSGGVRLLSKKPDLWPGCGPICTPASASGEVKLRLARSVA